MARFFLDKDKIIRRMYQIKKDDKVSYLYGTCHLPAKNIYLSQEALKAYQDSELIIFETQLGTAMDESLKNSGIIETIYEELAEQLSFPMDSEAKELAIAKWLYSEKVFEDISFEQCCEIAVLPPIVLKNLVEGQSINRVCGIGQSIDQHLANMAFELGKTVNGLEDRLKTLRKIYGCDFNYEEHTEVWEDFLARWQEKKFHKNIKDISRIYCSGNLTPFFRQLHTELEQCRAATNRYMKTAIFDRDEPMAVAALPYLSVGKTFIAVGFFHIPGMVNKLTELGCIVTAVEEGAQNYELASLFVEGNKIND